MPFLGLGCFRKALLLPLAFAALAAGRADAANDPPQARPHYFRRGIVLCIGVDKYRFVPEVKFAEADAKGVGKAFETQFGFTPEYLLGPQATKASILQVIRRYAAERLPDQSPNPDRLQERDVFVLFFAGHGQVINAPITPQRPSGRDGFLVPYDARLESLDKFDRPEEWERQALRMSDLLQEAGQIAAQHVLVICDACCSGFMTQRGSLKARPDLQFLLKGRSLAALASTTDRQGATWSDELKHGFFTHALLEELSARHAAREPASLTDLFDNVRFQVATSTKQQMIPQMNSRLRPDAGEFIFLPKSIPNRDIEYVARLAERSDKAADNEPHICRGILERALERENLRTQPADVSAAVDAPDYRFSEQAAAEEQLWRGRFRRYFDNAAAGDGLAMAALHVCYARGLGTDPNPEQAYRWARSAYETSLPVGQTALGRCYLYGIGVPRNTEAARKLLSDAAEQDEPLGIFERSELALSEGDRATAETGFQKLAEAGSPVAQWKLGTLYLKATEGESPRFKRAAAQFKQAAEKGITAAEFELYRLLIVGQPGYPPRNLAEAKRLLESAARKGYPPAQAALGWEYYQERMRPAHLRLPSDPLQAKKWGELASAQDDSGGHMLLCALYLFGAQGINTDPNKAREYCEKAARGNDPQALHLQAVWYADGSLYPKNESQAKEKAEQAAKLGNAEAAWMLGVLYEEGRIPASKTDYWEGTPIHKHHALYWFIQSADSGNKQANLKVKQYARQIAEEKVVYFKFFERDYPQAVEQLRRMTR